METITTRRRPTTRGELGAWYRAALEEGRNRGLSMAAIADGMGVHLATLYSWSRKIARAAAPPAPDVAAGLVRVRLAGSSREVDGAASRVVLRLAQGRALEIPRGFDADDLQRLVRVIEAC